MADGYATATQAALRAALIADPGVAALIAGRVVDEPTPALPLPFLRFGDLEPVPDDTDGTRGALVSVGLEVQSRPAAGRIEATRILEAVAAALHRRPEVLAVAGYEVVEVEVLTWTATRAPDGASYVGTLALVVRLDG